MSSIQGQVVLTFPAASGAPLSTLRVASFPSLDRAIHAILPRWKALHPDVAIELSTRRVREHHEAMAQLLPDPAGAPLDVVGMSMEYLGSLKPLGLEDLAGPPYLAERWVDRLVPYTVRQARDRAGALLAIPADVGPGMLYYRADLIDRAGLSEADLSGSWEAYLEAGRKLRAATGAALTSHPCYLTDLHVRAQVEEGEGLFLSAEGEPLVRSRRFVEAFRLAVEARAAGIDAKIAPGWTDAWTERIRSGAIAAQLTGAWFLAHLSSWIAPETRGLWRTCVAPGGRQSCWGGAFYGIPRRAVHKDLAFDFIRLACFERDVQLGCFMRLQAFPALLEAQDDPSFDEPIPFLQNQPARRQWQRMVAGVRAGPVHALDPLAQAAMADEVCRVLEGKSIDAALADLERVLREAARG
jgi:multiple sugar transport system substrate-binding protein